MREVSGWWPQVWSRLQPDAAPEAGAVGGAVVLLVTLAVVVAPGLWRWARVLVTVVHELGHGLVGVLAGRRFTGLVLRPDMSGHAVTVGRSRGPGRVVTTWVGYPAPAVVGAGLVQLAGAGWAAAVLGVASVVLLGSLVRARSLYTFAVMVVVAGSAGVLWWFGAAGHQALALLAVGVFLLLGAWRHLGSVALHRGHAGSDPAVLARLTGVPAPLWNLSFAVVLAAATWAVLRQVAGLLPVPGL